MKSRTEKVLVVLLSVIIVIIAYKIIDPKAKNVFDEMYYGEKKLDNWIDNNSPLAKIKGIEDWSRKNREDTWQAGDIVCERYKKKYPTKKVGKWTVGFEFILNDNRMTIVFGTKIHKAKISIVIYNRYDVDKKELSETVSIFDKTFPVEESEIDEIPKIKEYLDKNNISTKDLKEIADKLLYEKVIRDWEKYTNSKYSKKNLGTVKIERSPLFDGVD